MIILAIETSSDDTCVAILEVKGRKNSRFNILANIVSSQVEIHRKWGGIYPTLAKREHQKNLPLVLKRALKRANLLYEKIDLVAVTVGPGLEPCLWTGVNFAKEIAKNYNKLLIPVNHIEAHILANWLNSAITHDRKVLSKKVFPAVCLVVSGGHTQLILMRNFDNYKILGETRDDAAGECFDKVARILGLEYPGGPAIASEAARFRIKDLILKIRLPRPMIYQKNYDFSFSGLKTAVLYLTKQLTENRKQLTKKEIINICQETQQAIIDVLIYKTLKAAKNYKAKSIILGGGVAANDELRKQFKQKIQKELSNIQYLTPSIQFCTDNAAMVGVAAYFHWPKGEKKSPNDIEVNANLRLA